MFSSPTTIPEPWNTRYRHWRAVLYAFAFATACVVIYDIIFPTQVFIFDFAKPSSLANTVFDPRDLSGNLLQDGVIQPNSSMLFNAGLFGFYSHVTAILTPHKKSAPIEGGEISIRKSFGGFLLPTAQKQASFPTGTLLTDGTRFGIINTAKKRVTFQSDTTWQTLGFHKEAFLSVSSDEFTLNPDGGFWSDITTHPDSTLFLIQDNYYQLRNGQLSRFVSENAYRSQYEINQALPANTEYFERYPESEEWIGFRNGSLLAFADGIFFVNGNIIQPIGSPEIFTALGFDWNRVIPASEEETSVYKRGRVAVLSTPQPIDTLFFDTDTHITYIISDKEKFPIESPALLTLLTKNMSPITVSSRGADTIEHCPLTFSAWNNRWSCKLPTDSLLSLPGNNYEITVHLNGEDAIRLAEANARFASSVSQSTFRLALSQIKQRIFDRYGK